MARKQFLLRIDPGLYAEVERWAQAELRSVNGQIEFLLRQAVQARKGGRPGGETGPEGAVPDAPWTGSSTSGDRDG